MIELAIVIIAATIADIALGEPHKKIHPTVWMGTLVGRLVVFAKEHKTNERTSGMLITLCVVGVFAVPLAILYTVSASLDSVMYGVLVGVSGVIALYVSMSAKSMLEHVRAVLAPLEQDNIEAAQQKLATVVKRKTGGLDAPHILSGLVETISENTVDGIISPMSYFALAGAPGALGYRAINTIDAMIGYKTAEFRSIGWFGAGCDRALNYVPARITSGLIVVASAILGLDWRNAFKITRRDHSVTASPNAGYPMAAMAGALRVRLEKVDHYVIGGEFEAPTVQSVRDACKVMLVCTGIYASALAALLFGVGALWWRPLV